jgi:two-component system response regulator MtrA
MKLKQRVLLIDDDPSVTHVVARLLKESGIKAFEVNEPAHAVTAAREWQPDAAVVDYRMPYLSGVDVAWQFAADRVLCSVPIMIFSGATESIQPSALPSERIPVIPKPFNGESIIGWLRATQARDQP